MRIVIGLLVAVSVWGQKPDAATVLRLAEKPAAGEFVTAVETSFPAEQLEKGTAALAVGGEALFVVKAPANGVPQLFVNDVAQGAMKKAGGYYAAKAKIVVYDSNTFHYVVKGERFGGRVNLSGFGPESYEQAGVPKGTVTAMAMHESKIYPGMRSEYWVYAPAQVDAAKAAPVMIWQDGQNYAKREANNRLQIQIDNLTHAKRIPAMVHVFIRPGMVGERAMRSVQYDTYNDTYARFLLEEILVEVGKKWSLRKDGYSRAIGGESSGGICAFNAAWWRPEEFARVYSRIGSFTSIQWKPGELDGGNIFPFAVRKQPKRNIRVYLSDGAEDLENRHGSWPLQNIQMANSLKMAEYDFQFRWGTNAHDAGLRDAEAPLALEWLWRDYDAAKTGQEFVMDSAEKTKPYYRVKALNRQ
jgi:enterochelin esterase family protein